LLKAVIRHNLSLTVAQGGDRVDKFQGTTCDLLGVIAAGRWERVGQTQASGTFRLMMSEMGNFPMLAQFYREEVVVPGERLVARILQRGMDVGAFRQVDIAVTARSLIFPMLLPCMHKHSFAACHPDGASADDLQRFLASHVDLMVHGPRPRAGDAMAHAHDRPSRSGAA